MSASALRNNYTMIMFTVDGFYAVPASGLKRLEEEAADHGMLNAHITRIEDIFGKILWVRSANEK